MTLTELFLPLTTQEFPPSKALVYINAELRSLELKQLPEYETMYTVNNPLEFINNLPCLINKE